MVDKRTLPSLKPMSNAWKPDSDRCKKLVKEAVEKILVQILPSLPQRTLLGLQDRYLPWPRDRDL
jgi:hypothetical protein